MIHTKKDLLEQVDYLKNNVAYNWQIDSLKNQISALKQILIDAGILVDAKGVHKSIIIVDGEPYSILKEKK